MALRANQLYPIAISERGRALAAVWRSGVTKDEYPQVMARTLGEWRRVKAGEWYISGAIPEAYYQPKDAMSGAMDIAELVTVRSSTQYHITGVVPVPAEPPAEWDEFSNLPESARHAD